MNELIEHIQTFDEEDLWQVVLGHLPEGLNKEELKQKFGEALDQLQDMAKAYLQLPQSGALLQGGVTSAICEILRQEQSAYAEAVTKLPDSSALNEVLRIAYRRLGSSTRHQKPTRPISWTKTGYLWPRRASTRSY